MPGTAIERPERATCGEEVPMFKKTLIAATLFGLVLAACTGSGERTALDEPATPQAARPAFSGEHIAASEVPLAIVEAAQVRLPGFEVADAERETERGVQVYSLKGMAAGRAFEIEVTTDGRILEVEADDDDDDGDDDDDDDGDDDGDDDDDDDDADDDG
jgi:hypothetical protein